MVKRARRTLLVVDDEEDLLFMVALAAEATGKFDVVTARDGEEGLAKARRLIPDAVVLDGIMPRMDGFELCRRLREDPETRGIGVGATGCAVGSSTCMAGSSTWTAGSSTWTAGSSASMAGSSTCTAGSLAGGSGRPKGSSSKGEALPRSRAA